MGCDLLQAADVVSNGTRAFIWTDQAPGTGYPVVDGTIALDLYLWLDPKTIGE